MSRFSWRLKTTWWLTARLTPWLRSSQESYFERLAELVRPGTRILDIGCGKEFLPKWLRPDLYSRWSGTILGQAVVFGIDPWLPSLKENPSPLTACALAGHLPFSSATFDLVTANMVAEHLTDPSAVLREVTRVLKPGGAFVFHTPNLNAPPILLSNILPHGFKRLVVPVIEGGRQAEDVFPTIYKLNSRASIESAVAHTQELQVDAVQYVFTSPFTKMLGPFVIFELLAIRLLRGDRFSRWRPDIVCTLRKPAL